MEYNSTFTFSVNNKTFNACTFLPFCAANYLEVCLNTAVRECEVCNAHSADALLVFLVITAMLILIGNGWLLLTVFLTKKKSKTGFDNAKASLAMADIMTGFTIFIVNIPHLIWSLQAKGIEIKKFEIDSIDKPASRLAVILLAFGYSSSTYHILYMTLHRFIAIKWPFYAINESFKKTCLHLVGVWGISAIATLAVWFPEARILYQSSIFTYLPIFHTDNVRGIAFLITSLALLVLPYVAMVSIV
ncbi:unnamed protein product [Clavelina lepadiformis]|uniref:G-protein coupled receptors family 1 profile domain-containing protein n=1 Tax=Clavelina lepadiformis TaxID=159417 RepID=A0ABP0GT10_CLALP